MAEFKVRTKGNSSPKDKPRVYFVCHPDDFEGSFDRICEDVFNTHSCAIFYTEDMSEPLDQMNIEVDLGRMNLFLVPVTYKLMCEDNRAMSVDIAFAKERNIPILTFMMETGLDTIYSLPKNFGERQYLNPNSTDATEVSYADKLKLALQLRLISGDTLKRIRDAFDAYIFLSYRKKDRRYANELMRIIHAIPGCRDIAIWYDEFLTPGESFLTDIEGAMEKSELFALLVTPSILEDGNFVMREEYPAARRAGMKILPTEMEDTDHGKLSENFDGIPDPVRSSDEKFCEEMRLVIKDLSNSENDGDPEHNYLIGLAYLHGIDVETDVERGIELITLAAEAGHLKAMESLYFGYADGRNLPINYDEALKWAERIYNFYAEKNGEGDTDTISWLNNRATVLHKMGNYKESIEILEEAVNSYLDHHEKYSADDDFLVVINNLGAIYVKIGRYVEARSFLEMTYELCKSVVGEDSFITVNCMNNLATAYSYSGDDEKACEMLERVCEIFTDMLGSDNINTIRSFNNLAYVYDKMGRYERALEIKTQACEAYKSILGENHPETIVALSNLAASYLNLDQDEKALKMLYDLSNTAMVVLGNEHPEALNIIHLLAKAFSKVGDYSSSLRLGKYVYSSRCKAIGENHPDTLDAMVTLVSAAGNLGYYKEAIDMGEIVCAELTALYGKEHPKTLSSLDDLSSYYELGGNPEKALELKERVYSSYIKIFGEEDIRTAEVLNGIGVIKVRLMKYDEALGIFERAYAFYCRLLGEEHDNTVNALNNIAFVCCQLEDYERAATLQEKVIEIYGRTLGEKSHQYANAKNNISVSYYNLGRIVDAILAAQTAYSILRELFGDDNEHTEHALSNLNYLLGNIK